ncbi:GAF domain-containing protein [Pedobacter sp. HMF7647]|uniref:histidine kinase n=1 Tax=Hufsiella arboris TaxID=2695275 RepID=A0A7K1YEY2_9SPHI|nr:ATP-binding protein [Hufsiella arboris]MXV53142.1 GAF domain-containing protein [Hufsiella arboris]
MFKYDLSNCDQEPIHIPGKIQSHGFLVAVNEDLAISFCSENVFTFLGVNGASLLNQPIEALEAYLSREKAGRGYLRQYILLNDDAELFKRMNTQVFIGSISFNLIINSATPYYLLEFEPEASNLQVDLQQQVGRSLSEMLADKQLDTLLKNAAEQIRRIIQYDRVMVYKFHEDGHGEVVAEARDENLESWMGLHYPASDIPKQARELYKQNLVRLIADVYSEPSSILITAAGKNSTSLDLTCSTLRAVSPVHIQYLKNMGVASSFSVSIMDQGALWGLIACHNYSPRFINFRQRESAKLIGQVLSSAISFRQQEEHQQKSARARSTVETITRQLLRNVRVQEALINDDVTMQSAIESTGAALYFENELHTTGNVPEKSFIEDLITWLDETSSEEVYQTSGLSADLPEAIRYKDIASGILACKLSQGLKEYMIWFRPELITTVTWAGNPEKPVEIDEHGLTHISPRHSFDAWSQEVKNASLAWTEYDIDAALLLRDEVNYSISRRATELRILNEKLREAYAELDTFSYTISHDLKHPLTTIKSYSQLIHREAEADSKIRQMAGRIQDGAVKMQVMIEEVLQYSKIGQSKTAIKAIDMRKLLEDLRNDLLVASDNPKLTINIGNTPELHGDETMISQVFSNLLGNAVKYSSKTDHPAVIIGGEVMDENTISYSVSDNGIGIAPLEQERIFDLFSRAKEVNEFEGTGVGLAIVKRILDKHYGKIRVESQPGQGSVFHVMFRRYDAAELTP